jgi:predicted amidohydrolase YtcJ
MRRVSLVFLAVVLLAAAAGAEPSLVLVSGKVFTGDAAHPFVEAVAIEGDRISAVGTTAEIRALAGERTRVIDLAGRTVIPGINDAHMHPGFATAAFRIDQSMDPKREDLEAAIRNAVEETPADLWILGTIGPTVLLDPTLTSETLEASARGRKVMLTGWTGHGAILSEAAMKALGVAPDARDPQGGWFGRDADGHVDGHAYEYAQYPLGRKIADLATDQELIDNLRGFSDEALSYGITSVQVMPQGTEPRFADALKRANVPLRVRMIDFLDHADTKTDAVKWILDGTPIERNAALRTLKYPAGGQGRQNFSDLTPLVRAAADSKRQLLVHAVGDLTVQSALRAFAQFPSLVRPRIEHGDGLQRDLFPLALRTGTVIVQNPSHFQVRDTFPHDGEYQLFESIRKAGIPIALGSDGLTNPYLNILFATERQDNRAESLTREDAVRAYTSGSAYAEMKEKEKGTLAKGMLADLAVLSQDIFTVPAPSLPETQSVMTIIGGKVVYTR